MTTLVLEHLQHADSASPDITIDSSGRIGIGTTSPDCALDVTRTSGWAEMHLDGAAGGDLILKDNGVSYGEVYAGNGHGMVLKSYANQHMSFLTDANATAKMTILANGNVGIGTDSPDAPLSFGNNIPSDGQTIHTYQSGNTVSGLGIVSGQHRMFTNTGASLSYGHVSTSDGSTYTERMQITSAGHINVSSDDKQIFWGTGTTAIDASSSNNRIRFYTNNSEHVRIDSSGTLNIISSDVVLGSGANSNNTSYTDAANSSVHKRFETDGSHFNSSVFSDPAIMGPNKFCVYDEASWKGGIGLGSNEMQYYTGGAHSFYKHTGSVLTKHMEITSNGHVTMPKQPAFRVSTSSSSDITTQVTIGYDTEQHDRNNNFNTSTHRFTAPVDGVYQFTTYHWHKSGTGGVTHLYLYVNATNKFEFRNTRASSHSEYNRVGFTTTVELSANDYVYIQGEGTGGGQLHTSAGVAYSQFSGYLIG